MRPEVFVQLLRGQRASAILRCADQALAADAMAAAVRGGFTIVEFTLTIPGALELIADLSRGEGLVVGAGTVLDSSMAEQAVAAGARYLVSPVFDPEVLATARRLGVAMMPGVHTPTEALAAHRAGAPLQKVFPAPAGGPAWVRSTLAPLPFLRLVPTNGVDQDNALAWLEAGAWAVGFTTSLFDPELLARRDVDAVEKRARTLREIVSRST